MSKWRWRNVRGKCLIVEGRSDKLQIEPILNENVTILCTNGTIGVHQLEELLDPYESCELFTFLMQILQAISCVH